jgi:hypothetical protein
MFKLAKRASKSSSSSLELPSSLDVIYLVETLDFTFFFLPSFAMRHLWPMLELAPSSKEANKDERW